MFKVLGLLKNRLRLTRPIPPMSVPAQVARDYRTMGRRYFVLGVAGIAYGAYGQVSYNAAMSRPPQSIVAVLSPQGAILKTMASDGMTESEMEMVARATAAQFVARMRNVTRPIDFTLAAIDEGRYFVKDQAEIKTRNWLASRPFDLLVQRRQKRVVLLEEITVTIRPGAKAGGDKFIVSVQWPETVESAGAESKVETHGGEVLVERVHNVSAAIALHNPIGMFVSDFNFDTID